MALYLSMDGVDDYIKTPAITFNKIVFDMDVNPVAGVTSIYADARTGIGFAYIQRNSANNDGWGSGSAKVNGVSVSNNTPFVPNNTRVTLEWSLSLGTDDVTIFTNNGGNAAFCRGKIYDIKFYNGATLSAHYNMSTGTVQDQSGNGKHAILTGGTWLDDGVGGGTGTPGSISLDLKQSLYGQLFTNIDVIQKIHKVEVLKFDSKQNIYNSTNLQYASKQIISKLNSIFFDTVQDIYSNAGIMSSISYITKQIINNQNLFSINTQQNLFKQQNEPIQTAQKIFKISTNPLTSNQIIFKPQIILNDTKQTLYKINSGSMQTSQQIFKSASNQFSINNQIFKTDYLTLNSNQIIFKNYSSEIGLLQSIYEMSSSEYQLLQTILSSFSDYHKIIEFILNINSKNEQEIKIALRKEFDINL